MFWWYLVESAAASEAMHAATMQLRCFFSQFALRVEVAVNLLLPCMVCSRRSGTWQPPPESGPQDAQEFRVSV